MSKKIIFALNKLCISVALLVAQPTFAANFNIAPYGTLPTTVITGQTVSANYTVTNMTNTTRNGYVLQGFSVTVTQNTTSPNCGNPINLAANASCNLQLDITGAVSSNFAICKGNSCTTATTPLNVSATPAPSGPTGAYVSNQSNTLLNDSVTYCTLNPDTNFIDSCQMAGGSLNTPLAGVIVNHDKTMAFLTTQGGSSVYQCSIDNVTGLFDGTCTATQIGSGYTSQYGIPAFNATGSLLYLLDSDSARVLACSISGNSIQTPCVDTGATNIADSGGGVQLVLNSSNTLAYIASYQGYITQCQVTNNGQTFSSCTQLGADNSITFEEITGIALTNDNAYLYLMDNDQGNVYRCSTSVSGDNLTNCSTIAQYPYGWSLTLNPANSTMYVAGTNSFGVKSCPVNGDGSLGVCSTSTGGGFFDQPSSVALF